MDENTNVPEVRRSDGTPSPIRALKRVNPQTWPEERLQWLWDKIKAQDYAFDDTTRDNHVIFLTQLFQSNTEAYEYGDAGFVFVTGIVPPISAMIHFVTWEEIEPREVLQVKHQIINHLFTDLKLMRVTAAIPSFNTQAIRLATIAGFKYEGEMRKAFLHGGKYFNLHIYGILRDEFFRREVRH